MSTKLKPFDLEAALRGEPVVTRHGEPVTQVTKFEIDGEFSVIGVIDGGIEFFTVNGRFRNNDTDPCDLFMATKIVKKEGWVNLLKDCEPISKTYIVKTSSKVYADEGSALNRKNDCFPYEYIATVKIEWEEEA